MVHYFLCNPAPNTEKIMVLGSIASKSKSHSNETVLRLQLLGRKISMGYPARALKTEDIIFHIIIGLFGMYRITKRPYKDNPESTFTPLPRNITPLGIELDPTTGADISNTEKK